MEKRELPLPWQRVKGQVHILAGLEPSNLLHNVRQPDSVQSGVGGDYSKSTIHTQIADSVR